MSPRGSHTAPLMGKPDLGTGLGPQRPEKWPAPPVLDEAAAVDPITFAGDATTEREARERQIIRQALSPEMQEAPDLCSAQQVSELTLADLEPIVEKFRDQLYSLGAAATSAANSIGELNRQQRLLHTANETRSFWWQVGLGVAILVAVAAVVVWTR